MRERVWERGREGFFCWNHFFSEHKQFNKKGGQFVRSFITVLWWRDCCFYWCNQLFIFIVVLKNLSQSYLEWHLICPFNNKFRLDRLVMAGLVSLTSSILWYKTWWLLSWYLDHLKERTEGFWTFRTWWLRNQCLMLQNYKWIFLKSSYSS